MADSLTWLGIPLEEVRNRLKTVYRLHKKSSISRENCVRRFASFGNTTLNVSGVALSTLVQRYQGNVVGAFLTADWLIREPAAAQKALAKKRQDYIVSPQERSNLGFPPDERSRSAQAAAAAAARLSKTQG
jgi:hypothetical protein